MDLWVAAIYLPIAGAVVGLATKWAAIKLMFHPAEFVGVGKVGWQGIVQRRSPKFAAGVADTVTGEDLSVDSLLARLDVEEARAARRAGDRSERRRVGGRAARRGTAGCVG